MQTELTDGGAAPAPTSRILVERPPPGLARGKYAWPAWSIGVLGASIVLCGLVYFALRGRRRRQQ